MGRPVSQYIDAYVGAGSFKHYSEAGYTAQGSSSLNTPGYVNVTLKQPVGVIGVIIPWNAPLIFLGQKLAPALIAGCTCIIKSSEKAPLTVSLHKSSRSSTDILLVSKSGKPY